jgi:hypothetical protein
MSLTREQVLGRWDIVSWLQLYDDGRVQAPLGEKLEGFLRYCPDGDLIVFIERANRPNFTSGGQWNASEAERAAAYSSVLSYAGTFRLEGDTVVHEVRNSLYPGWKGGEQRRAVRLEGDTLYIEARLEAGTSEARTAQLKWRRAGEGR